jgi:hypothetical protein
VNAFQSGYFGARMHDIQRMMDTVVKQCTVEPFFQLFEHVLFSLFNLHGYSSTS